MKPQLTQEQIDMFKQEMEQKIQISPRLLELSHYDINIPPHLATQLIQLQRGVQQPYYAESNYASLRGSPKPQPQQFENSFAKAMLAMQKRTSLSPKIHQNVSRSPNPPLESQPEENARTTVKEKSELISLEIKEKSDQNPFEQRILAARQSLNKGAVAKSDFNNMTELESLALQSSNENDNSVLLEPANQDDGIVSVSNYRKHDMGTDSGHEQEVRILETETEQIRAELKAVNEENRSLKGEIAIESKHRMDAEQNFTSTEDELSELQACLKEVLEKHLVEEEHHLELMDKLNAEKEAVVSDLEHMKVQYEQAVEKLAEVKCDENDLTEQTVRLEDLVEQVEQLKKHNIELENANNVLKAQQLPETEDLTSQMSEKDEMIKLLQRQLENRERIISKEEEENIAEETRELDYKLEEALEDKQQLAVQLESCKEEAQSSTSKLLEREKLMYEQQVTQRNQIIESLNEQLEKQRSEFEQEQLASNLRMDQLQVAAEEAKIRIDDFSSESMRLKEQIKQLQLENESLITQKAICIDCATNCTIMDSTFPEMLRQQATESEELKNLLQQTTKQNSQLLDQLEQLGERAKELGLEVKQKEQDISTLEQQLLNKKQEMQEERLNQIIQPPLQTAVNYVKQAVFEIQNAEIVQFSQTLQFLIEQIRGLIASCSKKPWTYLFEINLRNELIEIPFCFQFKRIGNLRFKQFVSDDNAPGEEVFKLFLYILILDSAEIGQEVKRFPSITFTNGDFWAGVE